jgi:WD40 repeat protein
VPSELPLLSLVRSFARSVRLLVANTPRVIVHSRTPTADLLFSGSWDNTVQVWDVSARQCIKTIPLPDKGKTLT